MRSTCATYGDVYVMPNLRGRLRDAYFTRTLDQAAAERIVGEAWRKFNLPDLREWATMYEHLNLKAWPFQLVPDAESARIWAGRSRTKKQLERLLWKMQFAPKSGLHLLWANFGMGKTHTLLHLRHLCQQTQDRLIPLCAVMPRRVNGFLDVYRERRESQLRRRGRLIHAVWVELQTHGRPLHHVRTGTYGCRPHPHLFVTPQRVLFAMTPHSDWFEKIADGVYRCRQPGER